MGARPNRDVAASSYTSTSPRNMRLGSPRANGGDESQQQEQFGDEEIPAGYVWDEEVGYYYNEQDGWYYDAPTQQYYDPDSQMWYDPVNQIWQ